MYYVGSVYLVETDIGNIWITLVVRTIKILLGALPWAWACMPLEAMPWLLQHRTLAWWQGVMREKCQECCNQTTGQILAFVTLQLRQRAVRHCEYVLGNACYGPYPRYKVCYTKLLEWRSSYLPLFIALNY